MREAEHDPCQQLRGSCSFRRDVTKASLLPRAQPAPNQAPSAPDWHNMRHAKRVPLAERARDHPHSDPRAGRIPIRLLTRSRSPDARQQWLATRPPAARPSRSRAGRLPLPCRAREHAPKQQPRRARCAPRNGWQGGPINSGRPTNRTALESVGEHPVDILTIGASSLNDGRTGCI